MEANGYDMESWGIAMVQLQLVLVKEALQYREPAQAGRGVNRATSMPGTDRLSTFVGQMTLQTVGVSKGGLPLAQLSSEDNGWLACQMFTRVFKPNGSG